MLWLQSSSSIFGLVLFCHVHVWGTSEFNLALVSPWHLHFNNKTLLYFKGIISPQVSPSLPTWALLSRYEVSCWRALPMASKKAGFSELLFNRWTDENLSFLFCHRGSSHTSEQKSAHHIARDYRSQNCTKSPSLRRSVSKASLHSLGSICLIIRFCPCPPLRTLPGPVSGSITHCPSAKCYRTGSSLQDCR